MAHPQLFAAAVIDSAAQTGNSRARIRLSRTARAATLDSEAVAAVVGAVAAIVEVELADAVLVAVEELVVAARHLVWGMGGFAMHQLVVWAARSESVVEWRDCTSAVTEDFVVVT